MTHFVPNLSRFKSLIARSQNQLELEAKIGVFTERGFQSSVPRRSWYSLLNRLKSGIEYFPELRYAGTEISRVELYEDNIRHIIVLGDTITSNGASSSQGNIASNISTSASTYVSSNRDNSNNSLQGNNDIWQMKMQKMKEDIERYDIRVSLNEEEDIDEPEEYSRPIFTRERTRDTFFMRGARIDMTRVMSISEDRSPKPTFEIELEWIDDTHIKSEHTMTRDQSLDMFSRYVERLYMLFRDTHLLYTSYERVRIEQFISKTLGREAAKDVLVQARGIKRSDIVYGGIVGNPQDSYYFTFKADGHRKILVVKNGMLWLCYPPYEFSLIQRLDSQGQKVIEPWNNCIFDGELLRSSSSSNTQSSSSSVTSSSDVSSRSNNYNDTKETLRYFVFDTVIYRSSSSIQNKGYYDRLTIASNMCATVMSRVNMLIGLSLEIKETYLFNNPDTFFDDLGDMIERKRDLDYKQDGIMAIPSGKYNYKSDKQPMNKRVLTSIPDVCKIKDVREITIDFEVIKTQGGGITLRVYDDRVKKNVDFKGSKFKELTPDMIDIDHPMTRDVESGVIVEYEFNFDTGVLQPKVIRNDKSGPNTLQVAEANWGDIISPLTDDDLSGKTLTFAFSYQNRIKRGLINLIPRESTTLDIGTGRGGDLMKFSSNRVSVIAIEPNEMNAEELIRRNEAANVVIDLLLNGGEESNVIRDSVLRNTINGKVDAVTAMLSLSFFWRDEETLESLITTISENLRDGGKFLFLTIDGNALEQIFQPAFSSEDNSDNILELSTSKFILHPKIPRQGRSVTVSLPGTIVGEQQEEYLVKMNELTKRLRRHNIYLTEYHRAEHERLLPVDAKRYSSLFSYGYYTKDDTEWHLRSNNSKRRENMVSKDDITQTPYYNSKRSWQNMNRDDTVDQRQTVLTLFSKNNIVTQ